MNTLTHQSSEQNGTCHRLTRARSSRTKPSTPAAAAARMLGVLRKEGEPTPRRAKSLVQSCTASCLRNNWKASELLREEGQWRKLCENTSSPYVLPLSLLSPAWRPQRTFTLDLEACT